MVWKLQLSQARRHSLIASAVALCVFGATPGPKLHAQEPQTEQQAADGRNIVDIKIEGNESVSQEIILSNIKSRTGRPFNQQLVREDVKSLFAMHRFYDVKADFEEAPAGITVIYKVVERPFIGKVSYIGNKKIKAKALQEVTQLRPGKPMDAGLNKAMAQRIESHYHDEGYPFATAELVEGGQRGDKNVVFKITEGPYTKVLKIRFEGNKFVSSGRLQSKVNTSAVNFNLLPTWYGLLGKYEPEKIEDDLAQLTEYYRVNGFLDMKIDRRLEFTPDRSGVYVTFVIDEGQRYKVNNVRYEGNKIFKSDEIAEGVRRITSPRAPTNSGDPVDLRKLAGDDVAVKDVYGNKGFIKTGVTREMRYGEDPGTVDVVYKIQEAEPKKVGSIRIEGNVITRERPILSRIELTPGETASTEKLRRSAQRLAEPRIFKYDPKSGAIPTVDWDPSSDPDSPFQDVIIRVQEEQTGSIMLGVGVNSDSGVGGQFVLSERNFDIARFPRSIDDILSGRAWRGAAQEFRLEIMPGNDVSSYRVSFREPRLLGSDIGLSTSGYYTQRFYEAYHEERGGGRFSLSTRLTRDIGVSAQYRIENVRITDPAPVPIPDLQNVVGNNFLTSLRFAVNHTTLDSMFDPSEGHSIEAAYEQVFGDFTYPVFTVEGKQFWTVTSRGDGSGKHTVTARGEFAWCGSQAPIFERFYAGGIHSLRGFDFRGVGPVDFGTEVGGDFMMLAGLQYQMPITADDNLGLVFFVDSGTVERQMEISDYRVAAGFGIRLRIPQMGPAPLAFDFGFPIVQKNTDDRQIFSFYLGMNF